MTSRPPPSPAGALTAAGGASCSSTVPPRRPGPPGRRAGDLDRCLDALMENAINYAPSRSTVSVVSAPGRVEVSDRGPGIDEDERELVFERFRRGRAGRNGPAGSGLGLAIARELAWAWDGSIEITAREGGGTTVSLCLPERAEPAPPGTESAALPALDPPARSLPGR